jgi:hypothetical protein
VEAGSNTSTVALQVLGGDEKGTQCLGVYLGHPVPGVYIYGDLAPGWVSLESETVKYGHKNDCAGEDQRNCKRQTGSLVRESVLHQQTRNGVTVRKNFS